MSMGLRAISYDLSEYLDPVDFSPECSFNGYPPLLVDFPFYDECKLSDQAYGSESYTPIDGKYPFCGGEEAEGEQLFEVSATIGDDAILKQVNSLTDKVFETTGDDAMSVSSTTDFTPAAATIPTPTISQLRPITKNDKSALDVPFTEEQLSMKKSDFDEYLRNTTEGRSLLPSFIKSLKCARRRRNNRVYARNARSRKAQRAQVLQARLVELEGEEARALAAKNRVLKRTIALEQERALLDSFLPVQH